MEREREFLRQLATSMLVEPALIDEVGVTVKGTPARAESHVTAGYALGEHFVVTCDPAVESNLAAAAIGMAPSLDGWKQLAESLGGELLGAGRMQLLPDLRKVEPVVADGYTMETIRSADPIALALVERLVAESDEDDLDEAEVELDDLDEIIDVALDAKGQIAAYASARDFELAIGYGDIGVLTHADHRGSGLGIAVVQRLCNRLNDEGVEPLYRCDEANVGSMALSASMGFVPATRLVGYRFSV